MCIRQNYTNDFITTLYLNDEGNMRTSNDNIYENTANMFIGIGIDNTNTNTNTNTNNIMYETSNNLLYEDQYGLSLDNPISIADFEHLVIIDNIHKVYENSQYYDDIQYIISTLISLYGIYYFIRESISAIYNKK
jgi:hypothetical protein